jgi:hypothetical protein
LPEPIEKSEVRFRLLESVVTKRLLKERPKAKAKAKAVRKESGPSSSPVPAQQERSRTRRHSSRTK